MNTTFFPSLMQGSMTVPASKSEAHRRMICAGLTHGTTVLSNFTTSKDMEATANCLKALGVSVDIQGSCCTITGFNSNINTGDAMHLPVLDCGESGSTLRFFVPVVLSLGNGAIFRMHGRLAQRPMDVYRDLFVPRGVNWHTSIGPDGCAELTVCGKMQSDNYVLPGNVSSQFVSGMLFALPLLNGDSTLTVLPPVESVSYIRMTIGSLEDSGIKLEQQNDFSWKIFGNQQYNQKSTTLSGDYSQSAVMLCASAIGQNVTVCGLSENSVGKLQGDYAVIEDLEKLGAEIIISGDNIKVKGGNLHGAELNMQDTPDIAPMLALTCVFADGKSRLTHCGRLRLKECDRLKCTVAIINKLGGNAEIKGDDIIINGNHDTKLKGGNVNGSGDHRMVMMASIAGSVAESPVTVSTCEALNKSWPDYLSQYEAAGGKYTTE